jgi:hypothetical protein
MAKRFAALEMLVDESKREAALAREAVSAAQSAQAAREAPLFSAMPTAEQMSTGVEATHLDVHYDVNTRPKESDTAKIKGESKEGDFAELKRAGEALIDLVVTHSPGQHDAVTRIFEIADRGIGGGSAMGSLRFGQSLKNGDVPLSIGPSAGITKRLDTEGTGSSSLAALSVRDQDDSLNDPRERPVHTEIEIAQAKKEALKSLHNGTAAGFPPTIFNAMTKTRTVILNGAMALYGLKRGIVQHRVANALLEVMSEFCQSNQGAPHLDEIKALCSKYSAILKRPDHSVEIDAIDINNPLLHFFSLTEGNQFISNNLLAELRKVVEPREYGGRIAQVGGFYSQLVMLPTESPIGFYQRLLSLGRSLRPGSNFNYTAYGVGVTNGTFDVLKPENIAGQVIISTAERIKEKSAAIRDCVPNEMFKRALNGEATEEDLQTVFENLKAAGFQHTPQISNSGGTAHSQVFLAAASGKGGGKGKGDRATNDKADKGKGKGERGRPNSKASHKRDERRSLSVGGNEIRAWELYKTAREILGPGFANLLAVVNEITKFCLANGQPDDIVRNGSGDPVLPLQLNRGYAWVPDPTCYNFNWRRDFYAMMQLLRDISTGGSGSNKQSIMSKPGMDYIKHTGVTDWKVLSPAEFTAAYRPSATVVPIRSVPVKIRGVDVRTFKA